MLLSRFLSFGALASVATAQWTIVAPAHYADWEGSSLSSLPFSGTAFPVRLQQVHVEPKGAVRTIRTLAFRSSAIAGDPRFQSRSVDLDLWMGHGTLAGVTNNFATNYTTPRQNVFLRRTINTPDYSGGSTSAPTAFDFLLVLDAPFVHNGIDDFVWETNVFGASGAGTAVPLDSVQSGLNLVIPSNYQLNGTGCTFATSPMTLRPVGSLQGFPVNAWILDWTATACPPSSPAVFLLGLTNPNLPVPGLCTNLYALPAIQVGGTTDAAGLFDPFPNTTPLPRIPYNAASVGARLETQAAVVDVTGPPRLYATNGASSILNPWTPTVGIARIYETPTTSASLSTLVGVVVQVGGT